MTRDAPARRRAFEQLPFDALPERPRLPHAYFDAPARTLEMRSRPFGAFRAHYRELGDGPPLLLVHGLMTTGYSYRYVLEALAARYRVIVPDLPGCGRSDKPDLRYGAPALAAWLGEFADALEVRGCLAVGNSLGGYLCMRAALEDPALFSRLVSIHAPVTPAARLVALHAGLALPGAARAAMWLMRRDPLRWAHRNVHYHDESLKSLEEAREYGAPLGTPEGARAFFRYLEDALAPGDFRAFVARLRAEHQAPGRPFPVPLMLVYAREDPMVPPAHGHALAALLPDARFEWLEASSHFAHVDSPTRVLPLLHDFLG